MLYAVIFLLVGVIVFQNIIHHTERKDLYDRIQSGTYSEYKATHQPQKPKQPTQHERMLRKWREMGGDDID